MIPPRSTGIPATPAGPVTRIPGTPRTKQTARKCAFPVGPSRSALAEQHEPFKSEASSTDIKSAGNTWDVRGSYDIVCPIIEDGWRPLGGGDGTLTLDLYLETKQGKQQMYAVFDFRVLEGIMRFEKPIPVSKKRKLETFNDDSDVEMDMFPDYERAESSREYSEKDFFLSATDKPTARRPTWRYRWRGSETGEGEIQLGSDNHVESITFSNKGTELQGTIQTGFAGSCDFTGVKVSSQTSDSRVDPEARWANNSREAHEYAAKARWGSRW